MYLIKMNGSPNSSISIAINTCANTMMNKYFSTYIAVYETYDTTSWLNSDKELIYLSTVS